LLALVCLTTIAGCAASSTIDSPTGTPSQSGSTTPATAIATTTSGALSLLLEPDAGMSEIYTLLASARHAIDLTMYELEDTHAEQLLAGDAARGNDVRVILDRSYVGTANNAAFAYLLGHGVHVRWASTLYALTHQKTMTIDSSVSVIMTLNWTSRYYSDTRDVAVIDRTPSDIAAIQSAFNADFDTARVTPAPGADLVWSPTTSLPDMLDLIGGAHHELLVENEEMDSTRITDALIDAAHRGVDVEICMTDSSSWSSAFGELQAAGAHVRVYAPDAALYIHAKVLVSDSGSSLEEAFVGSQNFSTESLDYNRELGILLRSPALIAQLASMIERDYGGATAWR
jgi:cardiolipin synthase A/B